MPVSNLTYATALISGERSVDRPTADLTNQARPTSNQPTGPVGREETSWTEHCLVDMFLSNTSPTLRMNGNHITKSLNGTKVAVLQPVTEDGGSDGTDGMLKNTPTMLNG